jgi:sigma-E factor negative regulatory protein RseA
MLQNKQTNAPAAEEEWLSALLDGELDEDEAQRSVRRLGQDDAATRRWSEYCLIGDALRGQLHDQAGLRVRIAGALREEATLLAPMPARGKRQPLVWLAAAATVAAVTWTIWSAIPHHEALPPMAQAPVIDPARSDQVMPYLAAHQDYAQGVVAQPEMHFTHVTLATAEAGR